MYASPSDFASAFGAQERAELEGADPGRLDAALGCASEEADSYIAQRYATPVQRPSAPLVRAVLDLARFALYDNRATEEVRDRRKNAIDWLRDIASGRATMPACAPSAPGSATSIAAGRRTLVYGAAFETRHGAPGRA